MYLEYDARPQQPLVHVEQAQGGVADLAVVQADAQFLVAFEDDLEDEETFVHCQRHGMDNDSGFGQFHRIHSAYCLLGRIRRLHAISFIRNVVKFRLVFF